jgi:hypothetical protein
MAMPRTISSSSCGKAAAIFFPVAAATVESAVATAQVFDLNLVMKKKIYFTPQLNRSVKLPKPQAVLKRLVATVTTCLLQYRWFCIFLFIYFG